MSGRGRRLGRLVAALLALGVAAACASGAPQRPVTSVGAIAGQWRGTIQFGRGPFELFYLTIEPSGRLTASWGATTRWGQVSLEGGQARFSLYIWSGELQYYEGRGERVIYLREQFDAFFAQVRPLT